MGSVSHPNWVVKKIECLMGESPLHQHVTSQAQLLTNASVCDQMGLGRSNILLHESPLHDVTSQMQLLTHTRGKWCCAQAVIARMSVLQWTDAHIGNAH